MHLQTFTAATMAEALAQVKSVLGNQAVILHTRTVRKRMWLGLRRREIVEITAGTGLQVPARTSGTSAGGQRRVAPALKPQALQNSQAREAVLMRSASVGGNPGRSLLETPAASSAAILGLCDEMTNLKSMIKDLTTQVRQSTSPNVPEDFFDVYLQLLNNSVDDELAIELVKRLGKFVRPEFVGNLDFVRDRLTDVIETMVPVGGPINRVRSTGPHVVALIGPTGVGKTTTIAKLAANLKLREKRRVGLITIDTYRIAAIDQLKKYADIIGSDLRVVNSADDLRNAIQSMADCEYVLIDTAGRSPKDTLKLHELKSFLNAASPDEVHLVLSTTASQQCTELAISQFGDVRADKIIFTKLDEAAHAGEVLNLLHKTGRKVSYVTTGQDVPDDIEVACGKRLARLILSNQL
jgi:flagellar biosynthesis protein FlhF